MNTPTLSSAPTVSGAPRRQMPPIVGLVAHPAFSSICPHDDFGIDPEWEEDSRAMPIGKPGVSEVKICFEQGTEGIKAASEGLLNGFKPSELRLVAATKCPYGMYSKERQAWVRGFLARLEEAGKVAVVLG